VLTYDFRLPPGPRAVEYALLAEDLGFRAVWCPEIPAFGHDIWVTLWLRRGTGAEGLRGGCRIEVTQARRLTSLCTEQGPQCGRLSRQA